MKMSEAEYILRLRDLEKRYGATPAVRRVSLDIRGGEFLTLLGPSGSGKTTVLLMIAGFEYPTEGEIVLRGKTINFMPPNKRDIGMVFQNYALFPHMTVLDNIGFPLRMRKVGREEKGQRVSQVLNLVQLPGYEHRYPRQLSGGQQQRIALARAIIFHPSVLLMDEPLGALDKKLREHMQLEIKHIQAGLKMTVIYVTHDQEEALVMSDRIAIMNEGRIEQVGTPDEIYEKPVNKFVASFVGESNFLEGRVLTSEQGKLTLRMDDGADHLLPWEGDVSPGEEVCFCIRPEKLMLARQGLSSGLGLKGSVEEVVYVGESLRYRVRVSRTNVLHVKEMNVKEGSRFKEGEAVRIFWDGKSLRRL